MEIGDSDKDREYAPVQAVKTMRRFEEVVSGLPQVGGWEVAWNSGFGGLNLINWQLVVRQKSPGPTL